MELNKYLFFIQFILVIPFILFLILNGVWKFLSLIILLISLLFFYFLSIIKIKEEYFRCKIKFIPLIIFSLSVIFAIYNFLINYTEIFKLAILTILIIYSVQVLFYYKEENINEEKCFDSQNKKNENRFAYIKNFQGIRLSYTGVNYLKNGSIIFSYICIFFLLTLNYSYCYVFFSLIQNNQLLFSSIITGNITLIGLSILLTVFPKDEFMKRIRGNKKEGHAKIKEFIFLIFFPFDYIKQKDRRLFNNQTRYKIASHLLVYNITLSVLVIFLCFSGIILDTPHILIPILNISSIIFFTWLILCFEAIILIYEGYICWEVYKSFIGYG